MIGLGSQYLTAAGFGRYRITAASLGNLDLLRAGWLTYATVQAILGAFWDDGWAVINATNAYLNGIAASDRDKATALAGFINEDPMMVCSLGLEPQGVTMPIRWLEKIGTGNTMTFVGYRQNNNTHYVIDLLMTSWRSWVNVFGSGSGGSSNCWCLECLSGEKSNWDLYVINRVVGGIAISANVEHVIDAIPRKLIIDETTINTNTNTITQAVSNNTTLIPGNIDGKWRSIKVGDVGSEHEFVPFLLKDGQNETAELLDLTESMSTGEKVFASRTGSFTIPDISYTPSTP